MFHLNVLPVHNEESKQPPIQGLFQKSHRCLDDWDTQWREVRNCGSNSTRMCWLLPVFVLLLVRLIVVAAGVPRTQKLRSPAETDVELSSVPSLMS